MKKFPMILKSASLLTLALAVLSCVPVRMTQPRMDLTLDADGARWVEEASPSPDNFYGTWGAGLTQWAVGANGVMLERR